MIRHHKKYTTGEKMTIRKLYNQGKSDKEIGEALGRSVHSVQMQRSKMRVIKRRKSKKINQYPPGFQGRPKPQGFLPEAPPPRQIAI